MLRNRTFRYTLGLCFLVVALQSLSLAQEEVVGKDEIADVDLDSLSDAELEAICTDRGFELVREVDDGTGEEFVYTHADYVDAARQCLAVEGEVEQILTEHPELLDELHAETERMKAEKERLEKELADAQRKLRSQKGGEISGEPAGGTSAAFVKRKVTETSKQSDESVSVETAKEDPVVDSTEAKETDEETTDMYDYVVGAEGSTAQGSSNAMGEEDLDSKIDLDDPTDERLSTNKSEHAASHDDGAAASGTNTEQADLASGEGEDADRGQSEESDSAAASKPTGERPLGLKTLARESLMELRDKVRQDLTKVGDIVLPKEVRGPLKAALLPIFRIAKAAGISTYDLMKRYLLAILESAKKADGERGGEASNDTEATT